MRTVCKIFVLLFAFLFSENGWAQAPAIQLQSITSTRLTTPTFATNANDGTGRMFILEQAGRILVVAPGSATATLFLDLTSKVITSTERGLLGLAFHPEFAQNRRFFVDYTRKADGAVIVAEYQASESNPNVADLQEKIILDIPHPDDEHNGGMLQFGVDGFLYIAVGDGGPGNDPSNHAQDLNSLLGKILRIDIDPPEGVNSPYVSPPSNPFYGATTIRNEIYAYGFRNPWRFSFDSVTQELYAGDVGQDAVEELDVVEPGGNYGWRVFEGWYCTNLGPAPCIPENYISPIYTYVHTGRSGPCAITGGYVYRGNKQTLPFGAYIFGDYCSGQILMLYRGDVTVLKGTTKQLTSFGVDEEGEIYAVGGTVDRIVNAGTPFTPGAAFTVADGGEVSFDTSGSNDQVVVNHAQIHANDGDSKPTGLAFIELRNNGILVNESAVPATSLISSGRIYGEVSSNTDTGIAIANPNMARSVMLSFMLADSDGNDVGETSINLPPGGQLSAFLNQDPFDAPPTFNGSLTFNASNPVSVVALRGIVNERAEFLTTTLPVVDLAAVSAAPVLVPELAAGGGWTTEIILLNPTDDVITGTVRYVSPEGADLNVMVDGIDVSASSYAIPGRASRKLSVMGGTSTQVGSFVITPDTDQVAPTVATVYAFAAGGVTVSATGSGVVPESSEFDIYADVEGTLGTIGSIQTGVAVANPTGDPIEVGYELVKLDGTPSGVAGELVIASNGQTVLFVGQFPGASDLQLPFRGVLRLSSATPIAALAIRGRYNERGEFLLSTTPPVDPESVPEEDTFIPQLVDGAGYSTEIVIHDLVGNGGVSGDIYFFDQDGQPIVPDLRQSSVLPVR